MSKINLHITVYGRVQGVGFRAFVSNSASAMGLKGNVKNQIDGTVYVEAEGAEDQVQLLVDKCKQGPGWAHVEKVATEKYPLRGFTDFKVKY